jgi:phosphoglucosamine mutase
MAAIAESWLAEGRMAKPGIAVTVMSNLGFQRFMEGLGIAVVRTPVGDRYVIESMLQNGFNLGGEQSGHIIMTDYTTTGDGLVAALQLLAVVKTLDRPVSEVCHRFDPVPQVLKSVRTAGGRPLENADVRALIEEVNLRLGTSGRLVVRASGTEPVIRIMAEHDDATIVAEVVEQLVAALSVAAA